MASDHDDNQGGGVASLINGNKDATVDIDPMNIPTGGNFEKKKENTNNQRQVNPSYVSSCSDSSISYENDVEKVDVNRKNPRNTTIEPSEVCSDRVKADICVQEEGDEISLEQNAIFDHENVIGNPNECNSNSPSLARNEDTSTSELPPEVLSRRVQSLESQLAAIQSQLSNVLTAIESKSSSPRKKSAITLQVPRVHRVSSILLNDLHESSDIEQEMANIDGDGSSPQKTARDSSPVPNLEYRSYTPTYEEELLKYRKSSRGMSLDNTVESDNRSLSEGKINSKINNSEIPRSLDEDQKSPVLRKEVDNQYGNQYDNQYGNETAENVADNERTEETSQCATSNSNKDERIVEEKSKQINTKSDNFSAEKQEFSFFETKWKAVLALFDSLNLDSRQHDGSATEDVDANMEEFLRVPWRIEELMSFGTLICADAFLHVLTVTPLKFIWSCLCLVCTILNPGKGFGWCRFHRRHLYQFVRVFVIYAVYKYCLSPISIGKMYHWIRGQAMLKLYVLMAMVEVFDRLMCSFGQDALDSLFWNTTRRPFHPRMLLSVLVVLGYAIIHSYILFVHVATLNVAMNSADQTLLTLLISGNFAEIKSTVFKKYNKQNLFKIVSSDICERFKLVLFLSLVLLLNCSQGGMNQEMVNEYVHMSLIIFLAEMLCDWIKHSFITKFNFIKSSTYQHYALILAGDITGVGQDGSNVDHTHKVVKRLGFAQIPLACVMARYVAEAVRYADNLSEDGDSNHVLFSMASLLAKGTRWQVGSMLITIFIVLSILKGLLGQAVENRSHTVIHFGPEPEEDNGGVSTNNPGQRRQAA